MKYIVTWVIISMHLIACPTPPQSCNKFGICNDNISLSNSMACFETVEKQMSKEFCSEEKALAFIEESKKFECSEFYNIYDCIKDIKLEINESVNQANALEPSHKAAQAK